MSTFSEILDDLYREIVRPDMFAMLGDYLNQTLRELHVNSQTNQPVRFDDNRVEDSLVVADANDNNGIFLWEIPSVAVWQGLEAVWYPTYRRYAYEKKPSVARSRTAAAPADRFYWYRTGKFIAFSGHAGDSSNIDVSYFQVVPRLKYYAKADRHLIPDDDGNYVVNTAKYPTMTSDQAYALDSNWLIDRHEDVIKEGTRAKAYKRMADIDRAKLCYSQYESMRIGMQTTETTGQDVTYQR